MAFWRSCSFSKVARNVGIACSIIGEFGGAFFDVVMISSSMEGQAKLPFAVTSTFVQLLVNLGVTYATIDELRRDQAIKRPTANPKSIALLFSCALVGGYFIVSQNIKSYEVLSKLQDDSFLSVMPKAWFHAVVILLNGISDIGTLVFLSTISLKLNNKLQRDEVAYSPLGGDGARNEGSDSIQDNTSPVRESCCCIC